MKKAFVQNSNYVRFVKAVKAVEQRGAREASILLVTGPAGLGKSETVDRFAMDSNAIYLRAKETWTKRGLLSEMATTCIRNAQRPSDQHRRKAIAAIHALKRNSGMTDDEYRTMLQTQTTAVPIRQTQRQAAA